MFGECSVMRISKNRYLATVMNNNCRLAQLLAASGCFLTNAVPRTDDVIEWNIFAPNNMFISNFVDRLREEGYGVQRLSTQNLAVENTLTDKQDEIIRYAYENGYYDVPKTIDTDSLCTRFNCSKSTLSVLLRGAEKKLIGVYLTTNRDRDKK
jgi:predicted DNA binding protein